MGKEHLKYWTSCATDPSRFDADQRGTVSGLPAHPYVTITRNERAHRTTRSVSCYWPDFRTALTGRYRCMRRVLVSGDGAQMQPAYIGRHHFIQRPTVKWGVLQLVGYVFRTGVIGRLQIALHDDTRASVSPLI